MPGTLNHLREDLLNALLDFDADETQLPCIHREWLGAAYHSRLRHPPRLIHQTLTMTQARSHLKELTGLSGKDTRAFRLSVIRRLLRHRYQGPAHAV